MYALDLFGVAVFAVTGALAAGRKRMDVFGIVVVAIVTALGGGTIRDLVLGIRPVLWVSNTTYVIVAAGAALVTFVTARLVGKAYRALLVLDALGLAVFTVIGCEKAMAAHAPDVVVVVMGMVTGVAGGMLRDILCGEIPLVLRREIYAVASLAGGTAFVLMHHFGVGKDVTVWVSLGIVLVVRLLAIYYRLSLPVLHVEGTDGLENYK